MRKRTIKRAQARLRKIAWNIAVDGEFGPQTARTIRKFQTGYNGPGAPLAPDGRLERATRKAIKWSAKNGGRCSANFRYREFASKGNGDVVLERALVVVLERIRTIKGRPISIVSGYRDPYHNDVTVKGAKFSQHKYGTGADVPESARITVEQATRAGATGIGYDGRSRLVQHVDVRHAGPNNTTNASVGNPTTWPY